MTLELLYKTEITEQDLLDLIDSVDESMYIEFKSDYYVDTSKNEVKREELCKDVSSFANANGGLIVCGVSRSEKNSFEVTGLGEIDVDKTTQRLLKVITSNSNISPEIWNIDIVGVELSDSKGYALVIKIPRGAYQPYRSELTKKFTIRRSNGNGDMTVEELRRAFNLSSTFIKEANQIRAERIAQIAQKKTPYPLNEGFKIALHVIPFSALGLGQRIDLSYLGYTRDISKLPQWVRSLEFHQGKHNQHGFASEFNLPRELLYSHTYIFRTGIIETSFYFDRGDFKLVGLHRVEFWILDFLKRASTIFQNLHVSPPFIVMVSLLDLDGYEAHLYYDLSHLRSQGYDESRLREIGQLYAFKDEQVLLDNIVMERFLDDYGQALRPLFDELYNVVGEPRSPNYDENGNWKQPKKPR